MSFLREDYVPFFREQFSCLFLGNNIDDVFFEGENLINTLDGC